ncbi:hypothetical protein PDR89_15075 [Bacillus cereus group sp. Bc002]|uniref:hypothetical protein n=1 Tax=Bacillus cereus group sp. Bc002 TaxID=3018130 RepID=UPI0022E51CAB|nr:hypothetical protein [Bacillus cereus group sp. Bc002]MDA2780762.1 hypothetical protein [Bacillus cereus group sp. Bc002]
MIWYILSYSPFSGDGQKHPKWTIEEKEQLTQKELLKRFTCKWLIENGLKSPLEKFWNSSPYAK